ncbi:MAG TPA: hypothetical protein O0X39_07660 [Methanocorpusculum sp.]|nr:hypothetical protein [Methanocorpusculum sp.]
MTSFTQNPEDIPKFREGVEKFIAHCLNPWSVTRISFDKDLTSGKWDYECDVSLCKFDSDDVNASLEWFCDLLDRFSITDYCLEDTGTAWETVCIWEAAEEDS